jgi:hypothetical protein
MPLARFHLYAQGPEIWIAPMLATAEFWVPTMRHIAREAGCVVLGIAPIMQTDWLAQDLPDRDALRRHATAGFDNWLLDGYSVIVDSTSTVLDEPLVDEDRLSAADRAELAGRGNGDVDVGVAGVALPSPLTVAHAYRWRWQPLECCCRAFCRLGPPA